MRLTIVPVDYLVQVDGVARWLPDIAPPADIHALQWFDDKGWIEYKHLDPFGPRQPNDIIDVLPEWALACVALWEAQTDTIV